VIVFLESEFVVTKVVVATNPRDVGLQWVNEVIAILRADAAIAVDDIASVVRRRVLERGEPGAFGGLSHGEDDSTAMTIGAKGGWVARSVSHGVESIILRSNWNVCLTVEVLLQAEKRDVFYTFLPSLYGGAVGTWCMDRRQQAVRHLGCGCGLHIERTVCIRSR
jgi:hypothetical protein